MGEGTAHTTPVVGHCVLRETPSQIRVGTTNKWELPTGQLEHIEPALKVPKIVSLSHLSLSLSPISLSLSPLSLIKVYSALVREITNTCYKGTDKIQLKKRIVRKR